MTNFVVVVVRRSLPPFSRERSRKRFLLSAGFFLVLFFSLFIHMPSRCGIAALVASAALAVLVQTGTSMAIKSPHVLLVVADDYGWNDVGYHQSNETTNIPLKTPTLDRLASEGRKLERYYVQPLCSPTRGTILTGKLQITVGAVPWRD